VWTHIRTLSLLNTSSSSSVINKYYWYFNRLLTFSYQATTTFN
jgi:hypothetical protein